METTSLSLNSVAILALAVAAGPAAAMDLRCPATHAGAFLTGVDLFDGPPSEHADLAPDQYRKTKGGGKSDWEVGYVFQAGRDLFIECQYGEKIPSVVLKADKHIRRCSYASRRDGRNALTCS